jgi:hypothetical protein
MTIAIGYFTLAGLAVGTVVPILIASAIWTWQMLILRRHLQRNRAAGDEVKHLPRPVFETMMSGQYYPVVFLQPLHWALPWMLFLTILTLSAGLLIDNGITISYYTLGSTVFCVGFYVYRLSRLTEDEEAYPVWWMTDPGILLFVVLSASFGILLDNVL